MIYLLLKAVFYYTLSRFMVQGKIAAIFCMDILPFKKTGEMLFSYGISA